MSIHILEADTINCVTTFAAQHELIEKEGRQAWAECFWQANYESFNEVWNQDLFVAEFSFVPSFAAPERIMELCEEIAYNSSDCPDWETGNEVKLLRQIYIKAKRLHQNAQQLAKEAAAARTKRWQEIGLNWLKENHSQCGDYAIIAELHEDHSDRQTDYFNSICVETRLLAWSNHSRNLFAEMRKAAETCPETAHLGVEKGLFRVMVLPNPEDPESRIKEWIYPEGKNKFDSLATAQAKAERYAAEDTANRQKLITGEVKAFVPNFPFGYEIRGTKKAIEHRENYSMGKGYYLAQNPYSGWTIRKCSLKSNLTHIARAIGKQIETESEWPQTESQLQVQALS